MLQGILPWGRWWRRRLATPDFFDALVTVRTGDGHAIVLGRFAPQGEASPLPPVVLCHGLAMNRRTFALEPGSGLAQRLAAKGRDVWVLELRGASPEADDPSLRACGFDQYARWDVPAALAHVREATGAPYVDWVGFSMGGMLAYAHLGALKGGSLRRLVTIGSPQHFRDLHPAHAFGRRLLPLYRGLSRAPLGILSAAVAPLLRPWFPPWLTAGLRPAHYTRELLPRALAGAMADVPFGVMQQFGRWVTEDRLTSDDGVYDYRQGLSLVEVPTLLVAGDRDSLAPPSSVTFAYENLGAREKVLLVVGGEGYGRSFDHLDLVLGLHAPAVVFPHVEAWLDHR
ncbi:MAG: alpha/beta fold hydrolase [Deltaproteobacteria bacterium]|nr:alpha/beta fold hydrolase [Deltaproteobacteria bacterium]